MTLNTRRVVLVVREQRRERRFARAEQVGAVRNLRQERAVLREVIHGEACRQRGGEVGEIRRGYRTGIEQGKPFDAVRMRRRVETGQDGAP
jgi:hypothetical protein